MWWGISAHTLFRRCCRSGAEESVSLSLGKNIKIGETVVGQPLGRGAPTLETRRVHKLPEAPGVGLGFELGEVGLDSVLFVLARVEDSELVSGLYLRVRLTNQNTVLDDFDQSEPSVK